MYGTLPTLPSGLSGIIWYVFWMFLVYETPHQHPRISCKELSYIETSFSLQQRTQVVSVPLIFWAVWLFHYVTRVHLKLLPSMPPSTVIPIFVFLLLPSLISSLHPVSFSPLLSHAFCLSSRNAFLGWASSPLGQCGVSSLCTPATTGDGTPCSPPSQPTSRIHWTLTLSRSVREYSNACCMCVLSYCIFPFDGSQIFVWSHHLTLAHIGRSSSSRLTSKICLVVYLSLLKIGSDDHTQNCCELVATVSTPFAVWCSLQPWTIVLFCTLKKACLGPKRFACW